MVTGAIDCITANGIQMKDEYDDEGNRNDNDNINKDMIRGHQANNYDMRRAHEMLQDDGFRRHMKDQWYRMMFSKRESKASLSDYLALFLMFFSWILFHKSGFLELKRVSEVSDSVLHRFSYFLI